MLFYSADKNLRLRRYITLTAGEAAVYCGSPSIRKKPVIAAKYLMVLL